MQRPVPQLAVSFYGAPMRKRIRNARIARCTGVGETLRAQLGIIERGEVHIEDEIIQFVGDAKDAPGSEGDFDIDYDGKGNLLTPGLVDCHTHSLFGGDRIADFAAKMEGKSYQEIAAMGGGIARTVGATLEESDEQLIRLMNRRLIAMRLLGVSCVEVKSGYGLEFEAELRLLRLINHSQSELLPRVVPTLLAAHALPASYRERREDYLREVCLPLIEQAAKEKLTDVVDVYIDEGAFTAAEAETIFAHASKYGLKVRAHIGQFKDVGGAEVLAGFGGLSGDHLEDTSDASLRAMADAKMVGVFLPGAWRSLRQQAPDARRFLDAGINIAVATDFNPGTSPMNDLGLALSLAVRDAYLPPEAALLSATVFAARACGASSYAGTLASGRKADLCLWEERDERAFGYAMGSRKPVAMSWRMGLEDWQRLEQRK